MSTVLRLLILVPVGFILAVVAAGTTVAIGIFGLNPSSDASGWIILFAAWTAAYAGAFGFTPWLIAVVFAESFGLRSIWFWFAVGGAVGGAAYAFTGFYGDKAEDGSGVAIHLAAGFVAGFVYWLVAGRNSGDGFVSRPGDRPAVMPANATAAVIPRGTLVLRFALVPLGSQD